MVDRSAADTTPYCPRPILRGVWRVRVQPHFRIRDSAGLPPHNRFPHLSDLLFLANINDDRLSSSWLALLTHYVRSRVSCVFKKHSARLKAAAFSRVRWRSRRWSPDWPIESYRVPRGIISVLQKRPSPSGTPIHAGKMTCPVPLPCHLLTSGVGRTGN